MTNSESYQIFALIRTQVEYYLSDTNLKRDRLFYERISKAPGGFLPLEVLLRCPKIQALTDSAEEVAQAIALSGELELSSDRLEVRRVHNRPLPPFRYPSKSTPKPPLPTVVVLRLVLPSGLQLSWRGVSAAFRTQFACEDVGYVGKDGCVVLPGDTDAGVLEKIIATGIDVEGVLVPVQRVGKDQLFVFWQQHSSHFASFPARSSHHQQYKLGGFGFQTAGRVKAYLRSLLAISPDDQPVDPQYHPFLVDLVKLHPEFEGKARGLSYFAAGRHPLHPESRTFFVVRTDGSREDFSMSKCLARI